MTREKNIEKTIRELIAKEISVSSDTIHRDTDLVNDLHADSMDIVNIVSAIESKFKITFPDESKIRYNGYTLQFLIDGVNNSLKESANP